MLGDKGTLFLQEKDGLQGLSGAVANNPATIQRAEGEATLESVGSVMVRAEGPAGTLVLRTTRGDGTFLTQEVPTPLTCGRPPNLL